MATSLLPFDELNLVRSELEQKHKGGELSREAAVDIIEELLEISYTYGLIQGSLDMGGEYTGDRSGMELAIYHKTAGKTFSERIEDVLSVGADTMIPDIMRIADTEMHRVYNTGSMEAATALGATRKTWLTMEDNLVRDSHRYLDNVYIGVDDYFYTYDGDKGRFPGDFDKAENNVNCRCLLKFS